MAVAQDSLVFEMKAKENVTPVTSKVKSEFQAVGDAGQAAAQGLQAAGSNVVQLATAMKREADAAVDASGKVEAAAKRRAEADSKANQRREQKLGTMAEEIEKEMRLAQAYRTGGEAVKELQAQMERELAVKKIGNNATEEQKQKALDLAAALQRQKAVVAELRAEAERAAARTASDNAERAKADAQAKAENATREASLASMREQIRTNKLLVDAQREGSANAAIMKQLLEQEAAARKLGTNATEAQKTEAIRLVTEMQKQQAEIEELRQAEAKLAAEQAAAKAQREQATAQRKAENDARKSTISGMREQVAELQRVAAAQALGDKEAKELALTMEREKAVRDLGRGATAAQKRAVNELTAEMQKQRQAIEESRAEQAKKAAQDAADKAASDAATAARKAANDNRKTTIASMREELAELGRFVTAQRTGEQAVKDLQAALEREKAVRDLGKGATAAQKRAVTELTTELQTQRKVLEDLKKTQADEAAQKASDDAKAAQRLAQRRSENDSRKAAIASIREQLTAEQRMTTQVALGEAAVKSHKLVLEQEAAVRGLAGNATTRQKNEVTALTAALQAERAEQARLTAEQAKQAKDTADRIAKQEAERAARKAANDQRLASIAGMRTELSELQRVTTATRTGEAAVKALTASMEQEAAARSLGANATTRQKNAIQGIVRDIQAERAEIERLKQAQADAARTQAENDAKEERRLATVRANREARLASVQVLRDQLALETRMTTAVAAGDAAVKGLTNDLEKEAAARALAGAASTRQKNQVKDLVDQLQRQRAEQERLKNVQANTSTVQSIREQEAALVRLHAAEVAGTAAVKALRDAEEQEAAVKRLGTAATQAQIDAVRASVQSMQRHRDAITAVSDARKAADAAEQRDRDQLNAEGQARLKTIADMRQQLDGITRMNTARRSGEAAEQAMILQLQKEANLRQLAGNATAQQRAEVIRLTEAMHRQQQIANQQRNPAPAAGGGGPGGLANLGQSISSFGGPASSLLGTVSGLVGSIGAMGIAAVAAGAGIAGLVTLVVSANSHFAELERLQNRVAAALKVTGGAAGVTTSDVARFASEMAKTSTASKAQILEASAIMASSGVAQGAQFEESIRLAQDLSVLLKQELPESAKFMVSALVVPTNAISALEAYGVTFSAQQEQEIKDLQESGDLLKAREIILGRLAEKVKGISDADADSQLGQRARMGHAWDALTESIARSLGTSETATEVYKRLGNTMNKVAEDIELWASGSRKGFDATPLDRQNEAYDKLLETIARAKAQFADKDGVVDPNTVIALDDGTLTTWDELIKKTQTARKEVMALNDVAKKAAEEQKAAAKAAQDAVQADNIVSQLKKITDKTDAALSTVGRSEIEKIKLETEKTITALEGLKGQITGLNAEKQAELARQIDGAEGSARNLERALIAAASVRFTDVTAGLEGELNNAIRLANAASSSLADVKRVQGDIAMEAKIASLPADMPAPDKAKAEETIRKTREQTDLFNNRVEARNKEEAAAKKQASASDKAASAASGEGDAIRKSIEDGQLKIEQTQKLIAAYAGGTAAGEAMTRQIEAEEAARNLAEGATDEQREAIKALTLQQGELNKTLEDQKKLADALPDLAAEAADYDKLAEAYGRSATEAARLNEQLSLEAQIRSATKGMGADAAGQMEAAMRATEAARMRMEAAATQSDLREQAETARVQTEAYSAGSIKAVEAALKAAELQQQIKDAVGTHTGQAAADIESSVRAMDSAQKLLDESQKRFEASKQLATDVGGAFTDAFRSAIDGGTKLTDVLKNLYMQLSKIGLDTFFNGPAQNMMSGLFSGLTSKTGVGASGGGGIGGFFSSMFGGMFGGGGTSFFPAAPGLGLYANGGDVSKDQPIIVGERRPEIFVPKSNGTIIPSLEAFAGGGKGTTINHHWHGDRGPDNVPQRSLAQVAAQSLQNTNRGRRIR